MSLHLLQVCPSVSRLLHSPRRTGWHWKRVGWTKGERKKFVGDISRRWNEPSIDLPGLKENKDTFPTIGKPSAGHRETSPPFPHRNLVLPEPVFNFLDFIYQKSCSFWEGYFLPGVLFFDSLPSTHQVFCMLHIISFPLPPVHRPSSILS